MSSPTPAVPSTSSAPPDCGQADARLDYIYGELTGAALASFEKHSATCPGCQRELAAFSTTRRVMSTLAPEPAPDAGLASLLQFAEQHAARARTPKRSPWMTWVMALVPTAAVAVLALKAVGTFAPTDASKVVAESEHFTAAGSPAAPTPAPVAPPPPPPMVAMQPKPDAKPSADRPAEPPRDVQMAQAIGAARADGNAEARKESKPDPAAGYGGFTEKSKAKLDNVAGGDALAKNERGDGSIGGLGTQSAGEGARSGMHAEAPGAGKSPALEERQRETFDELKSRLVHDDAPDTAKKSASKDQLRKADRAGMEEDRVASKEAERPADKGPEQPAKRSYDSKTKLEGGAVAAADDTIAPTTPPPAAAPRATSAKPAAAHQGMAAPEPAPVVAAPTPSPAPTQTLQTTDSERMETALASGSADARRAESDKTEQVIALYRNASYARADKNHRKAAQLFHQAYEAAPTGPRAADALLQAGIAEQASNQQAEAQSTFGRLVREFPSSREASEANSRLDTLRQRAREQVAPSPKAAAPAKAVDFSGDLAR